MPGDVQLSFPRRPLVLGIAGCSGSGKTTLARELCSELSASLLPLDFYYRDLAHLTADERAQSNFDHPDSLEDTLLTAHVEALAEGRAIQAPVYDFATHSRVPHQTIPIPAADVVIVEGILALHYDALHQLYDFSIFVNAPQEVCLKRRIHRDVRERGRTEVSVREQYEATARPMAERYVLPSATRATLTVEGTDSLDWSIEQTLSTLRRRGLLPR
jgi:uridine kinase